MNVAEILVNSTFHYPDRTAVHFKDRQITYGEFLDKVLRAANGLISLGVKPGDRVVIYAMNSIEWLIFEFAIWAAGAIMVPINHQYTADEAKHIVHHSESCVVIVDSRTDKISKGMMTELPEVRQFITLDEVELPGTVKLEELISTNEPLWAPVYRRGDDGVAIYYTSGTTGRPKGCLLGQNLINWGSTVFVRAWFQPGEVLLVPMPLAFVYASYEAVVPCIQASGTIVLLESFSPRRAMAGIQKHGVTLMEGVPTMYAMMLNFADADKYDISTLRYVVSAGSVLSAELAAAFRNKFDVPIVDFYALSEALSLVGYDTSEKIETRPFSCGSPFPGIEVKIFDDNDNELPPGEVGELVTRGPSVMRGYYKDPEITATALRGGWLHSGDLAKYDEDGFLYIVGRNKDLIIRGGANVFPSEIEDVLFTHPKVAEAAVVGTPDEIFGEEVRAVLVLKKRMRATSEEIREFCASKLAEYKVPKYVEFVDELPKGPTGKILKRAIKEMSIKQSEKLD